MAGTGESFAQLLAVAITEGRYIKLAYLSPIHEFYSENVVMRKTSAGLALSNGKLIQPAWIVSIDEVKHPAFAHIDDFTCDC